MTMKIEETGEILNSKYEKLVKNFSVEDLQNFLGILVCEPEFITGHNSLQKLNKKEKDKYVSYWNKLFMFDKKGHKKLLTILNKDFDVFKKEKTKDPFVKKLLKSSRLLNSFSIVPRVPLLIEIIKKELNLIASGKSIENNLLIKKIECFVSNKFKNDYQVVINENYLTPVKVSCLIKIWDRFLELVKKGRLSNVIENLYLYDYLNFNPNNRIIKNTEYPLQKIIEKRNNLYIPTFETGVYTEKALIQRQKKVKNLT